MVEHIPHVEIDKSIQLKDKEYKLPFDIASWMDEDGLSNIPDTFHPQRIAV